MNIILKAAAFAAEAHTGQLRSGQLGEPYISHPLRVAAMLEPILPDEPLAAALLHDVVEDCGVELKDLELLFGVEVAKLVSELSFPKGTSKEDKISLVAGMSHTARIIKFADLIDNVESINRDPTAMSLNGMRKFVDYALRMKVALGIGGFPTLEKRFADAVLTFELITDNQPA